ncbi:MAG TPA: hypothetical protein VEC96_03590, partial [Anaerolineae bacterium]|nr:hypothetical protein [Anaerolineae bacterium]
QVVNIRTRLPTLTPTTVSTPSTGARLVEGGETALVGPVAPASQPVVDMTAAIQDTPLAAPLDAAVATPPPPSADAAANPIPPAVDLSTAEGWAFNSVRLVADQYGEELLVYGDLINQTGLPQTLTGINGVFYNAQDQSISGQSILDFWPIEDIPPDSRVPFELTVIGLQDIAKVNLQVEARPGNAAPRQDFELSDLTASNQPGKYCLKVGCVTRPAPYPLT